MGEQWVARLGNAGKRLGGTRVCRKALQWDIIRNEGNVLHGHTDR